MTSSKNTKRALLASAVSVLLCAAMLIGSTFAWFTDSVTSGKNKIVAGNLDVELEYSIDGIKWNPVGTDTNLFKPADETLWEPGHTEYVYLRIRNAGSLALKYQLALNIYGDENGGPEKTYTSVQTEADGVTPKTFMLSKYLVFTQTEGTETVSDRQNLWIADPAAEKEAMGKLDGLGMTAELLPGAEKTLTLAVYMPTQVGNEANQLTSQKATEGKPTIFMGLSLVATQTPHESDSFDENYDKNIPYPVIGGTALSSSLKKGGTVILGDDVVYDASTNPDIDTSAARTIISGKTSTLDLGGKTITFDSGTGTNNFAAFYLKAARTNLTVNGEGTIDATATTGAYCFHLYGSALSKPTLTINGGTYIGNPTAVNVQWGTAYIKGGFFSCKPAGNVDEDQYRYTLNCVDANYKKGADIIVTGGTFVNFDPSNNKAEGPDTNFVAEGYKVVAATQENGDIWYTVVPDVPGVDETEVEDPLG